MDTEFGVFPTVEAVHQKVTVSLILPHRYPEPVLMLIGGYLIETYLKHENVGLASKEVADMELQRLKFRKWQFVITFEIMSQMTAFEQAELNDEVTLRIMKLGSRDFSHRYTRVEKEQ